ncbi:MAG: FeoB-associated Cys-rich membrane protein [Syntrophothermus sp.]|uniref:hypothetical protein n=1 Tax=Syntrophothermus sp. TaxID=2736299 RepID=UPI00257CF6A3|nr:hypothetical protein [Syntrophothermus sp.]NSW84597.1 FeoB-associated Cys-rich membrane protein [Syntrophothermus sp.]
MEKIIVLLICGLAIWGLIRHFRRSVEKKDDCATCSGCGGSYSCSANNDKKVKQVQV